MTLIIYSPGVLVACHVAHDGMMAQWHMVRLQVTHGCMAHWCGCNRGMVNATVAAQSACMGGRCISDFIGGLMSELFSDFSGERLINLERPP